MESASQTGVSQGPPLPPRFQVLGELGRGGMAVVYHAYDTASKRHVAIKFLPPTDDEEARRRFRREASDLAAVFHPNIVDFYALSEWEGQEFIEMEYVDGGSLSGYVKTHNSLRKILECFIGFLEGLQHIHNRGIVHRDLKPANVLVTKDGTPKISDLGLARRVEQRSQLTQQGTILGTSSYLAPEQLLSSEVGPPADLYAVGVCLFEAVTGDHPFKADNQMAMLRAHLEAEPRKPSALRPGLPKRLEGLILKLLAKEPKSRYATADRVRDELKACIQELSLVSDLATVSNIEGRSQDLTRLVESAGSCVDGGGLGCLLVSPAEVGRSLLLRELRDRLKTHNFEVVIWSPGQGLEDLAGLIGLTAERTTALLAEEGVEGLAGEVRRYLAESPKPTLLIFDDYERLNSLFQAVARQLAQWTPPAGAGWVVSVNKAQAYAFPEGPGAARLELMALDDATIESLLQKELKGIPSTKLKAWLLPRAAGSPRQLKLLLFLLRDVLERKENGEFSVSDLEKIPVHVSEALLAEVKKLDEPLLKVLTGASFLPEPVSFESLRKAAALSAEEADSAVEMLSRLGLLEGYNEEFRVIPSSLAQKLNSVLSDRLRKLQHERILQELGEELTPAEKGRHLALSGKTQEALPYLREAALKAASEHRFQESLRLWDLALGCGSTSTSSESEGRGLALGRAETLFRSGRFDEGLEDLEELSEEDDRALLALVDAQLELGHPEEAYNLARRALERNIEGAGYRLATVLEAQGNLEEAYRLLEGDRLPLKVKLQKVRVLGQLARFSEAEALIKAARQEAEGAGALETLMTQVELHHLQGRQAEAIADLELLAEQARESGYPLWEARAALALAELHSHEKALLACGRGVEILGARGQSPRLALALEQLARLQMQAGLVDKAEATFRESVRVSDLTEDALAQARARLGQGRFNLSRSESAKALTPLSQAVSLAESVDDPALLAETLTELASAHRQGGQLDRSLQAAERAVKLARQTGAGTLLGVALLALGEASTEKGRWKSALEALQEAGGLIPSGIRAMQVRHLEAMARLHQLGAQQEYPGLSKAEAQRYSGLAQALRARDGGELTPPTRKLPIASATSLTQTLANIKPPNKKALGAVAVALLVVVGLFTVGKWWSARPARLLIDSNPKGAVVKLDDDQRLTTPVDIEVPKGTHKFKVFLQGYKAHEQTVELGPGETFELTAALKSASGTVKVATKPEGAVVLFDGQKKGLGPLELGGVKPGKYKVKVRKEGYHPNEQVIEVVAGETNNLSVALNKIPPPPPPPPPPVYSPQPRYYPPPAPRNGGYRAPAPPPPPTQVYRPQPRPRPQPRNRGRRGDGYFSVPAVKVKIKNPF